MYVIVYKDYYSNTVLWAGSDVNEAIAVAKDLRRIISELNALVTMQDIDRYIATNGLPVTMYPLADPDRICVMHNYRLYDFSCCCHDLGLGTPDSNMCN